MNVYKSMKTNKYPLVQTYFFKILIVVFYYTEKQIPSWFCHPLVGPSANCPLVSLNNVGGELCSVDNIKKSQKHNKYE